MAKKNTYDPSLLQFATTEKQREVIQAVIEAGTIRQAATELGMAVGTVSGICTRVRRKAAEAGFKDETTRSSEGHVGEEFDLEESGDTANLKIVSHKPLTEEEVLAKAGLSDSKWRIKSHRKWTVTMKLRELVDADKGLYAEKPTSIWNYHYVFERLAPKKIQDSVEAIVENWNPPKLRKITKKSHGSGEHMIEIDLFDVHFGKLCWDEGTTGKNYDLNVAKEDFVGAVDTLLERIGTYDAGKFLLPIGNDFFQTDNWEGTTTAGTAVAFDDRISKVFQCGYEAVVEVIERLRDIAPVEPVWVPGNHDLNTSWHLFFLLSQRFRDDKHVKFDLSSRKRKYIEWGESVIGFQHGHQMKPEKMVMIAPTEFPEWGYKRFREIHCGHVHTRRDFKFMSASEHAGTMVRYMAALSETDEWHYDNGYVGNKRAAEAIAWHLDEGPVGTAMAFVS